MNKHRLLYCSALILAYVAIDLIAFASSGQSDILLTSLINTFFVGGISWYCFAFGREYSATDAIHENKQLIIFGILTWAVSSNFFRVLNPMLEQPIIAWGISLVIVGGFAFLAGKGRAEKSEAAENEN